jgi:hypothetical protein
MLQQKWKQQEYNTIQYNTIQDIVLSQLPFDFKTVVHYNFYALYKVCLMMSMAECFSTR